MFTEWLYGLSLESGHDEETGDSVSGNGWHALFRFDESDHAKLRELNPALLSDEMPVGAILHEDTQGFKDSDCYSDLGTLEADWNALCDESAEFEGEGSDYA